MFKYYCRKYKELTLSWNIVGCWTELFMIKNIAIINGIDSLIGILKYKKKNVVHEQFFGLGL